MDEALREKYRASTYLVCVDTLYWAPIRIGQPAPVALQALAGAQHWGFITAWNPRSIPRSTAENMAAQRQLLAVLHTGSGTLGIYPGVGIGSQGWYEPSLFVLGLDLDTLDTLCSMHAQNAYVYGHGHAPACLRELPA